MEQADAGQPPQRDTPTVSAADAQIGARVRAARSYAGITKDELAHAINVSPRSLHRIESGEKPIAHSDLETVADTCGVPRWFMTDGWDARPGQDRNASLEARTIILERQVAMLLKTAVRRTATVGSTTEPQTGPADQPADRGADR